MPVVATPEHWSQSCGTWCSHALTLQIVWPRSPCGPLNWSSGSASVYPLVLLTSCWVETPKHTPSKYTLSIGAIGLQYFLYSYTGHRKLRHFLALGPRPPTLEISIMIQDNRLSYHTFMAFYRNNADPLYFNWSYGAFCVLQKTKTKLLSFCLELHISGLEKMNFLFALKP